MKITNKVAKIAIADVGDLEGKLKVAYEKAAMKDFQLCGSFLLPPAAPTHLVLIFQKVESE